MHLIDQIRARRDEICAIARKHKAARLWVFGSCARREERVEVRKSMVLLDADVAELYGVETREVNQAVRNNRDKFPVGHAFALAKGETADLRLKPLAAKISPKSRALGRHCDFLI